MVNAGLDDQSKSMELQPGFGELLVPEDRVAGSVGGFAGDIKNERTRGVKLDPQ